MARLIVIIHQHVGMHAHTEALAQFAERLQEMESVGVIAEDIFAFVAASGDVIASAGPLNAQGACLSGCNQRAWRLSSAFVQMTRRDPSASAPISKALCKQ